MGSLETDRTTQGWAAQDGSGVLAPYEFQLRDVGSEGVEIKVLYCGVCHTDLHQLKNDYGMSRYPMVAGHEVVGVVTQVGSNVSKFKVGDNVGIGVIVGSCNTCNACTQDMEQYCPKKIWSYNDAYPDGVPTYGGFAKTMVADQSFIVSIPEGLPLDVAAPLLCAGITVYSPMKHFGMTEPGKKCGILGLGGVGHMGVKFAKAFGLHVTVISSSKSKENEAKEVLGADDFLVSSDPEQMAAAAQSLDYIIDTIPAVHPLDMYLPLLGMNGKLIVLGVAPGPLQFVAPNILLGRRQIAGSFIGSIKETQEMLDFSAKNSITCMIETITLDYINEAIKRLEKNDVRYRFVVDVEKSYKTSS